MNWDAIGAIGELIGGAVVIVTIIYLARQVRQNTHQVRLNSNQAVDVSNNAAFDPIYIPENHDVWYRGHLDYDSLTDKEAQLFEMLMFRLLGSFMTTSYHYDEGGYTNEFYHTLEQYFASVISTPGGARVYKKYGATFPKAIRDKLEAYTANQNPLSANTARAGPPPKRSSKTPDHSQ